MKLRTWHLGAKDDLEEIVDYMAIDNIEAMLKLALAIVSAVEENLPDNTHMGRLGRVDGTRELAVQENYIFVCEASSNAINVLNFFQA